MILTGTIKLIMDLQTFDSGFTKQEIVITTTDQYPQDIKIEFVKDKIDLLSAFAEGSPVDVSINIRGNEYNGKYYVSIQGWRIEEANRPAAQQPEPTVEEATEDDDLPF